MANFHQVTLAINPLLRLNRTESKFQCSTIWDPTRARFDDCFIPVISALPAGISACIFVVYIIRLFTIRWPRWTTNFVEETSEDGDDLIREAYDRPKVWMAILLAISITGFALQVVSAFLPFCQLLAVFSAAAWALSGFTVIITRPRTAPLLMLVLYISILVAQLIVLSHDRSKWCVEDIPALLGPVIAFCGIVIVLCMPMRNPELPSDEISPAFGSPTSKLRSPEDNLTPWQFMTVSWMAPLISVGTKRQLHDEDVWDLAYEFKHRRLHDAFRELRGSVVRRLLEANGTDLMITSILGIVELLANLSAPVLLQQLLRSMEDPDTPARVAITYAVLSLFVRLVASQSAVFSLWFSRRAYERSRGEMITMLYEKTLNRKIRGVQKSQHVEDLSDSNEQITPEDRTNGASKPQQSWLSPFGNLFRKVSGHAMAPFRSKRLSNPQEEIKQPASMGKILNLMRNDVYEVAQRFWEFQNLVTKPLGLLLSIVLVWRLIGWPCLLGILTVLAAQVINTFIARALLRWERKRRTATDGKLQKISQFVEAIRNLRWYGWQDAWLKDIMEARQHELNLRIVTMLWSILISFMNTFASNLFPVAAFYAYTILAGLPLRIDIAFPALDLFRLLESNLREIPGLITVLLNASVAVGRIEDFMSEPDKDHTEIPPSTTTQLKLNHASFAWPGAPEHVLHDITLDFPVGLTVVYGEVAAGKTALLQALLGEIDKREGDIVRPDEMVGYCAQTPWLQSMSIRENILFSSPYDDTRYKQVLEACALVTDMANFKHGDLSNIGENGIGLSGGQKARVALARAVYSKSRILFLDDPLSALDHQTAETIVRKCLAGPLLEGRTTVLVTHRTELCHGLAKQWVEMSRGRARLLAPETNLSGVLHQKESAEPTDEADLKRREEEEAAAVPDKFMEDEHRAHGGVKASIYWEYIRAGKLKWWFVLICIMAIYRLLDVAETWFVKQWGESYNKPEERSTSGLFDDLPSPETNVRPWLIGFFLFATAVAVLFLITQGFMLVIVYSAGQQMFKDVMDRVAHATFRFYDTTPVGRLMNRLTSDINTIDGNISEQFQNVSWLSIAWISSIAVIASVTPLFLVFSFALSVAFVLIFLRFLPTSQSLRRLEMVSLSPLMSNFGALLDGLTTVRAFCAQNRFQARVIEVTDAFQKMDHFYWSLQAWLMYRFDTLSACSTLLLTLLALHSGVSPGLTAFVLIAASKFVTSTHALCRQYGQLQMDFVSVERVVELLHLDQESPGSVSPPAWWPSLSGDIVFEDVTVRYAPHLDPSLSRVSFRIPANSNTAIIGRTGSGKSTLALSLLATIVPETGRILIDNMDISTVDRQALRRRVTFLAQEPVLFPGTMRQNLDPLSEYSDAVCSSVLEKIAGRHNWTLDTPIEAGGRSLSQGQRQLVGLARAMLRRSAVVILDEATASIDMETAMRIQQVLREEMRESTVITIAHRLEAVRNADYCIVLGKGEVLEAGSAEEMLKQGERGFGALLG
ncbi:P-loop containing nucleoside triphosphate hydrolase protein [Lepidopterella palustris CBS 459.81]|uniref:P-loop containing nucleoside triphosphate hydrolase protein n=1 Tax=Lepidopterella palustris CBS 459.81 TaxID=1314670 RepID=A0A8E2EL35_9PEZI|nr:P-loop containing nucleoside triphosphate hydrolase protein [Lepidopterella palustris CBS 459.81]